MNEINFKKLEDNLLEKLNVSNSDTKETLTTLVRISVLAIEEYHRLLQEVPAKDD